MEHKVCAHRIRSKEFDLILFADPTIPITNVPCHGCGALLQCADTGLSGFLPSELIRYQSDNMLRVITGLCRAFWQR